MLCRTNKLKIHDIIYLLVALCALRQKLVWGTEQNVQVHILKSPNLYVIYTCRTHMRKSPKFV